MFNIRWIQSMCGSALEQLGCGLPSLRVRHEPLFERHHWTHEWFDLFRDDSRPTKHKRAALGPCSL